MSRRRPKGAGVGVRTWEPSNAVSESGERERFRDSNRQHRSCSNRRSSVPQRSNVSQKYLVQLVRVVGAGVTPVQRIVDDGFTLTVDHGEWVLTVGWPIVIRSDANPLCGFQLLAGIPGEVQSFSRTASSLSASSWLRAATATSPRVFSIRLRATSCLRLSATRAVG